MLLITGRWILPKGKLTCELYSTQVQFEIRLPIRLTPDQWIRTLEQLLLLLLIMGRWILPKGKLTHDQLSQLLLVYIGTAADIVEFFEAFKEEKVFINHGGGGILWIVAMLLYSNFGHWRFEASSSEVLQSYKYRSFKSISMKYSTCITRKRSFLSYGTLL